MRIRKRNIVRRRRELIRWSAPASSHAEHRAGLRGGATTLRSLVDEQSVVIDVHRTGDRGGVLPKLNALVVVQKLVVPDQTLAAPDVHGVATGAIPGWVAGTVGVLNQIVVNVDPVGPNVRVVFHTVSVDGVGDHILPYVV